ncbi:hypothetical protein [Flavobacterium litorale]|uniref:Lipoprotein n=1 Tax=Flavobacterium litorale TaxID=2856519 RepID=A0ABX8VC66_9FLAO|nr:hypothetical protein [Flavobacterium litorale]QYJ68244.1 hypothetical protein K1I41_12060 [Flavobacterium litorale]
MIKFKHTLLLLFGSIVIISCKPMYFDINGYSYITDNYSFNFGSNFNEFYYNSTIHGVAEETVYYKQHFRINLPKKIITFAISDNDFFFEFPDKQIIYIKSDYETLGVKDDWIISDYYGDISSEYPFIWYWKERGYNIRYLQGERENRINKLYSNGKIDIILYNIKPENVEKYLTLIKSFKIVDYDKIEE